MTDETKPVERGQLISLHFSGNIEDKNLVSWAADIHGCSYKDALRIFIGSYGGNIDSALTLKDILESKSFNLAIIGEGTMASASWYLFTSRKYLRLTYANTLWLQHNPSYSPSLTHDEMMAVLPGLLETSQRGHQTVAEGLGLSYKEVDSLFDFKGTRLLGIDTIWVGKYGITDGVIYKEVDKLNWIVLTTQGLKLANIADNSETLKAKALLSDEELNPHGLKQYVPKPRTQPTLKTSLSGLNYLTKQAEQLKTN